MKTNKHKHKFNRVLKTKKFLEEKYAKIMQDTNSGHYNPLKER